MDTFNYGLQIHCLVIMEIGFLGSHLVRNNSGNVLGMLLLQRAEEILAIADKTEREFKDQQNLVGGEISIGSVEAITSQMLSKWLKAFNTEYPQVSYRIFSGT